MDITQELVDRIDQENYYRTLTGQPLIPAPQVGGDPLDWLTQLMLNSDGTMAAEMADQFGISQADLNANASRIDAEAQARRVSGFNPLERAMYSSGDQMIEAGPWGTAATLAAIGFGGAHAGAFGGVSGPGGYGAAAGALPVGAEIAPNGLLTGAASAAGGGVGTLSGVVPAVGASPGLGLGAGLALGPNGLPTGEAAAAGGGVGTMSGGVPAVGAAPGVAAGLGALPPGTEIGPNGLPTAPAGGGGGVGMDGLLGNLLGEGGGGWGALIGGLLGAIDAAHQPDSMTTNQGGTSTSTYGQTLPGEITGPANDALASLRTLFANGAPVAGVDPASLAAIQGLQGFASGSGINPYLDTVFNSAADSTRNRLTTEFARSGRNLGAALPARSEDLQHLAAGIYGPGYEAERQRQYNSLLPLLGGGDYLRGINQQQMDAPYTNLARYMSGIQGLAPFFPGTQTQSTEQTGSVTQPLFNNPLAGFLGGAQLGSLFGG